MTKYHFASIRPAAAADSQSVSAYSRYLHHNCRRVHRHRRCSHVFRCVCVPSLVCANWPISRSSRPSLLLDRVSVFRRVRRRCHPTTRLNGKREQRCPLRFHMSSVFENRQARCAHLWRTRQKIQFGPKDQRLFADKGRHETITLLAHLSGRSTRPVLD